MSRRLGALKDAETGERLTVDVADPAFRSAFEQNVARSTEALAHRFRRTGVDVIRISADSPYADRLMRFFRQRARRFR